MNYYLRSKFISTDYRQNYFYWSERWVSTQNPTVIYTHCTLTDPNLLVLNIPPLLKNTTHHYRPTIYWQNELCDISAPHINAANHETCYETLHFTGISTARDDVYWGDLCGNLWKILYKYFPTQKCILVNSFVLAYIELSTEYYYVNNLSIILNSE